MAQNFRSNASWQNNGLLDLANQVIKSRVTIRHDVEDVTALGKHVILECILSLIYISKAPHILLITNDVFDRVNAERAFADSMRQLEKKELAKTRFLAAAGHDLRQPLTAANMFIHALKSNELNTKQSGIVEKLEYSMKTFAGLLEALLNVSKLDAGRIKPIFKPLNVAELIMKLEQNFEPMARIKNIDFRLYFSMKEALTIRSDLNLLESVLMNLVGNAIKFTSKGAVLLSARKRGDEVLFQVWDTGIGLPDEYIEQIFDEFYQVNNQHRDRENGLGLGLSIVKRTLALLGSEVSCRSRLGHGTVFEFCLPLVDGLTAASIQGETEDVSEYQLDSRFALGKKFVVVEDDILVVQAMTACLDGMGGEVKCFHSAEEGLLDADIEHADYYIVDYMLGGKFNGIQFLNLLRQKTVNPIRAVLVTGDTSSNFIIEVEDFDWPVQYKPVDVSALLFSLSVQ